MVQNSSSPSPGDDGAEPFAECSAPCGTDAFDVLIRVAPVLKCQSLKLAGGDRELRKDLLQEGSCAVVRAVDDFNPAIGTLDGFAADRAVKQMWNICRKHRRHHKKVSYRDPHPTEDDPGFDPPDPSTEQCASCAADYERVRELIPLVLTMREQQVIRARYYRRLTVTKVAKRLKMTKGRVSQLESAALAKLRLSIETASATFN